MNGIDSFDFERFDKMWFLPPDKFLAWQMECRQKSDRQDRKPREGRDL